MGFRVLKAGMLTTVQDLGRYGYQSQGISVSGVMDVRSFKIANLLLDNPENEACLEITLIGPTLQFTSATIIAITGGDFDPTINDEPAPMYTAIYVNKGDVLRFRSARTGSRCYVAFSSYLDIPVVMGSRCTNLKSQTGGLKGRKEAEGGRLRRLPDQAQISSILPLASPGSQRVCRHGGRAARHPGTADGYVYKAGDRDIPQRGIYGDK